MREIVNSTNEKNLVPLEQCKMAINRVKEENAPKPIEAHPDFNNYIKRDQCQQMLHNYIRSERQQILDKYACFDGATYRKGSCDRTKKIGDFDIKEHPDFSKYISRKEASELMTQKLKSVGQQYTSVPIERHPDYSKLKATFNGILKEKLQQLKNQLENFPIEKHRDYKKLMDMYACFEGDCDNRRYIPCPSCKPKTLDITSHPDIDKYILKDEAKQVCQQIVDGVKVKYGHYNTETQSYQPCSKKKLSDYPEFSEYVRKEEYSRLANRLKNATNLNETLRRNANRRTDGTGATGLPGAVSGTSRPGGPGPGAPDATGAVGGPGVGGPGTGGITPSQGMPPGATAPGTAAPSGVAVPGAATPGATAPRTATSSGTAPGAVPGTPGSTTPSTAVAPGTANVTTNGRIPGATANGSPANRSSPQGAANGSSPGAAANGSAPPGAAANGSAPPGAAANGSAPPGASANGSAPPGAAANGAYQPAAAANGAYQPGAAANGPVPGPGYNRTAMPTPSSQIPGPQTTNGVGQPYRNCYDQLPVMKPFMQGPLPNPDDFYTDYLSTSKYSSPYF